MSVPKPEIKKSEQHAIAVKAQIAGITRLSIDRDGVSLAFWQAGCEDGQPILFLHGVTYSSLSVFDLEVPGEPRSAYSLLLEFAERGYAAYALDFSGYGFSEDRENASLDDHCKDVVAATAFISRNHGGKKIVLIGWSWGAQVAARCMSFFNISRYASHLVFWGSCWGGGRSGPPASLRRLNTFWPPRRINTIAHAESDFITPDFYEPKVKAAFCRHALALDLTSPTLGLYEVARNLPLHDPERINVPVLAIHGSHDPMASPDDLKEFLQRLRGHKNKYVVVERADHNVQFSFSRGKFVDEVVCFLRSGS